MKRKSHASNLLSLMDNDSYVDRALDFPIDFIAKMTFGLQLADDVNREFNFLQLNSACFKQRIDEFNYVVRVKDINSYAEYVLYQNGLKEKNAKSIRSAKTNLLLKQIAELKKNDALIEGAEVSNTKRVGKKQELLRKVSEVVKEIIATNREVLDEKDLRKLESILAEIEKLEVLLTKKTISNLATSIFDLLELQELAETLVSLFKSTQKNANF